MRGFLLMLACVTAIAFCEENALKAELKDPDLAANWIYDDLLKAMADAKASNKPICMTIRCVPCVGGKPLDAQVTHPDAELEALEKNFVCVRVIKTNGLDLQKFQYDLDQSWTCFFMNADGTIYGRYGTRAGSGPNSDTHISLPSFKKSMARALALHNDYPKNKASLDAKSQGKPADYPVPEKIPGLEDRAVTPVTRKSCIHCHMVREFTLRAKWNEKKLTRADLFVYPLPEQVGMTMDPNDGLVVKSVGANSPAAKAGIQAGDEILGLKDQTLISQADIQWVLQNANADTKLTVAYKRNGNRSDAMLELSGNWKEGDLSWRASSFALRRALRSIALTTEEKKKLSLSENQLALKVLNVGPDPQKAFQGGVKKDDVIVAMDDNTTAMTESQFLAELRLKHWPGDKVKLTVLRGGEKKEATATMW